MSGGDLRPALDAGLAPWPIVFPGPGETDRELTDALETGIGRLNLELEEDGYVLSPFARGREMHASTMLRLTPDVDRSSRARITTGRRGSKSGVALPDTSDAYDQLGRLSDGPA